MYIFNYIFIWILTYIALHFHASEFDLLSLPDTDRYALPLCVSAILGYSRCDADLLYYICFSLICIV